MDNPDKEKTAPPKDERESANWSHDIENREYYYDDSTGYEVYDPDKEEDQEDAGSDIKLNRGLSLRNTNVNC